MCVVGRQSVAADSVEAIKKELRAYVASTFDRIAGIDIEYIKTSHLQGKSASVSTHRFSMHGGDRERENQHRTSAYSEVKQFRHRCFSRRAAIMGAVAIKVPCTRKYIPAVRVGILQVEGRHCERTVLAALRTDSQFICRTLSTREICECGIHGIDVVVVPGGSALRQSDELGAPGRHELKQFVSRGGGYFGICAGAFLALAGDDRMLGLLNARHRRLQGTIRLPNWGSVSIERRPVGEVKIELTTLGRTVLSLSQVTWPQMYVGGPIMEVNLSRESSGCEGCAPPLVLARYISEQYAFDVQRGTMLDTPAIVYGRFGNGRVVVSGSHPEAIPESFSLMKRGVLLSAAGEDGLDSC